MAVETRAIISDGKGGFADAMLELGDPGPGEVLVEIRASGVCHTDLDSLGWGRSLILGHEGAGVARAVGEGVTHVAPDNRVLLNWAIPCGGCIQCRKGLESLCEAKPRSPPTASDAPKARSGQASAWARWPATRSFPSRRS